MAGLNANIAILALCQALAGTATVISLAIVAIVGTTLAPDARLATLPVTLQTLATMAMLFPVSLLMQRRGRKLGFALGAVLGALGGMVSFAAIETHSFALYCLGSIAHGAFLAAAQFYRFAAAEAANKKTVGRAISLVVAGGVVAGLVGPELAALARGWYAEGEFAGSHLLAGLLAGATLPLVAWAKLPLPLPRAQAQPSAVRSLASIISGAGFVAAAAAATFGYAAMALVMTVTPLAVMAHHHGFDDAAWVIQWHVIAMFAPGFVTGWIIDRLGAMRVIGVGALAILAAGAINLLGEDLQLNFWPALVLLGIGWNFMYVGGTTLLTKTYSLAEKAKAQAANDVLVFSGVALATLSSGALFHSYGWAAVNWGVVPLIASALLAATWVLRKRGA